MSLSCTVITFCVLESLLVCETGAQPRLRKLGVFSWPLGPFSFPVLAATLGASLVQSRLDYANSIMYGMSASNMHKLQSARNSLTCVRACLLTVNNDKLQLQVRRWSKIMGVCRIPQPEFLGCSDTHDNHSGCATAAKSV